MFPKAKSKDVSLGTSDPSYEDKHADDTFVRDPCLLLCTEAKEQDIRYAGCLNQVN